MLSSSPLMYRRTSYSDINLLIKTIAYEFLQKTLQSALQVGEGGEGGVTDVFHVFSTPGDNEEFFQLQVYLLNYSATCLPLRTLKHVHIYTYSPIGRIHTFSIETLICQGRVRVYVQSNKYTQIHTKHGASRCSQN